MVPRDNGSIPSLREAHRGAQDWRQQRALNEMGRGTRVLVKREGEEGPVARGGLCLERAMIGRKGREGSGYTRIKRIR